MKTRMESDGDIVMGISSVATSLEIMVNVEGNHPQMAQQFRLVKY